MTDRGVVADLRSFYEREAELGRRGPLKGQRVEARRRFVALLKEEGRSSVLDLGAGPGHDAGDFIESGVHFTGIDLAIGNAKIARARGVLVVPGSIAAPPFCAGSFDAGWSMSTFMHVPTSQAAKVAAAMVAPLQGGAPMMVGLWGGEERDQIEASQIEGEQRLFSLRTVDQNLALLTSAGATVHLETWDAGPDRWEYQLYLVRAST